MVTGHPEASVIYLPQQPGFSLALYYEKARHGRESVSCSRIPKGRHFLSSKGVCTTESGGSYLPKGSYGLTMTIFNYIGRYLNFTDPRPSDECFKYFW